MTKRIGMWSGPRNISTAMMRSWENRPDTQVIDEPFYAYYLSQTQSPHPCFDEILASQPNTYDAVVAQLTTSPCDAAIYYQKLMTHHMLEEADLQWTKHLQHCFLIRDPRQVISSYLKKREACSAQDIGIVRQWQLYQQMCDITGQDIPIIDSNDVQNHPYEILSQVCEHFEIPFLNSMLSWPSGRRNSDGVWASHWYQVVEQSTGFSPYEPKPIYLTDSEETVLSEVMPYYLRMYEKRIRA